MSRWSYLSGTGLPRAASWLYPEVMTRVATAEKQLFLTFDDGPTPDTTPALLRLFAEYDVRATFFLLGKQVQTHPDFVSALHEAGHTLGNHTFTHCDPWQTPSVTLAAELDRTTEKITTLTGDAVRWMRPPYGHLSAPLRRWCKNHWQQLVLWGCMPADFAQHVTAPLLRQRILRHLRPGTIFVLHDHPGHSDLLSATLRPILETVLADGWTCLGLNDVWAED